MLKLLLFLGDKLGLFLGKLSLNLQLLDLLSLRVNFLLEMVSQLYLVLLKSDHPWLLLRVEQL